eukprot:COSAG01_NODE_28503_length_659_cov_1.657143_1_plen_52_part_10
MFYARGACQRGENCRFSHDAKAIEGFLKEQEELKKQKRAGGETINSSGKGGG